MDKEVKKLYEKWENIYSELMKEAKEYYVQEMPFLESVESGGSVREYIRMKNWHLINYPILSPEQKTLSWITA